MTMEPELGVLHFEDRGKEHKGCWNQEKARNEEWSSLRLQKERQHLDFRLCPPEFMRI